MLPKANRLKRSPLFPKTMASGLRLMQTPYFTAIALPGLAHHTQPSQFGFIVSKKVHNKAHERNKIKRRLRALVREQVLNTTDLDMSAYISLIFIAYPNALQASYAQLQQALQQAMRHIGVKSTGK